MNHGNSYNNLVVHTHNLVVHTHNLNRTHPSTMRYFKLSFTCLFIAMLSTNGFSQSYPMGMWHPADVSAFNDSLHAVAAQELSAMSGDEGSIINFVWGSNFVMGGRDNFRNQWYKDMLTLLNESNLDIVVNVRFTSADYTQTDGCVIRDGVISDDEFRRVSDAIDDLLDYENELIRQQNNYIHSRIIGWAIMDEPYAHNINITARRLSVEGCGTPAIVYPENLKSYRDRLYAHLENRGFPNRAFYLSEGATMGRLLTVDGSQQHISIRQDYAEFSASFDVLAIFYYDYVINREQSDIGDGGEWYNHGNNREGSLRGWNYIWEKAKADLGEDRTQEIHAILVLGEEIPTRIPPDNHMSYDVFEPEFLKTHAMTHASIRKVYNLGFDGISFYDWKHSADEYRNDAICWWEEEVANIPQCQNGYIESPFYSEAVATEIHDIDELVLSVTDTRSGENYVWLPSVGESMEFNSNSSRRYSDAVRFISTGDFWGEGEWSDQHFILTKNEVRSSTADGDDELVMVTTQSELRFNEDARHSQDRLRMLSDILTQEYFDRYIRPNYPCSQLPCDQAMANLRVTAITSGDFDGDGDSELIVAVYDSNLRLGSLHASFSGSEAGIFLGATADSISALASGDFQNNGRDELIVATRGDQRTRIYYADVGRGVDVFVQSSLIHNNPQTQMYVADFTTGKFNNNFRDQLVTSFRSELGNWSRITISSPVTDGVARNPSHSTNGIWASRSYRIDAIAAGDDNANRKDDLYVAMYHIGDERTVLFKNDISINRMPMQQRIFQSEMIRINAMTMGSFRESLHE